MLYCTLVTILFIDASFRFAVSEKEYVYIDKNKTWTEAKEFCKEELGARLSSLDQTSSEHFLQSYLRDFRDIWTNTIIFATPYLSIIGCFDIQDQMNFLRLSNSSVYECQSLCSNYSRFAIKVNKCLCLDGMEIFGEQKDVSLCNLTCEEETFCGGINNVNIYDVAQQEPAHGIDFLDIDSTSCLVSQCINNTHLFREKNCRDANVSEVVCNGYFSCSFEPGDPCFLIQSKNDNFDWIVETSNRSRHPENAFDGSYFAYIEDSRYRLNQTAHLISSTFHPGYRWCLRFRYYIISEYFQPLKVVFYNSVKRVQIDLFTLSQTEKEWRYKEYEINIQNDFIISFETKKQVMVISTIAIDDITMVQGNCSEPLTKLLYMKGNLNCNFEGNIDTCFVQDKSDQFNWVIQTGGTKSVDTAPENSTEGHYYSYIKALHNNPGDKALLISKFELNDVSVNISMQYHMYGEYMGRLKMYLKDNSNRETTLLDLSGSQGNFWNIFTNITKVATKSKVYIEATRGSGSKSDIAIDDIQIKIIEKDGNRNWMSVSQKCIRTMESYPRTIKHIRNTTCLLDGPERWIGVIRPKRMYSDMDDLAGHPTSVKLLKITNNVTTTDWEPFELNKSRPFVCESDIKRLQRSKVQEQQETLIVMIPVVFASLFIFIAIIAIAIIYKRMKNREQQRNMSSVELPTLGNTTQHPGSLSPENSSMNPKLFEEDYDHLHEVKNTITSTKDDEYSHMLENQYGIQEHLANDTYDHTVGLESEYGASRLHEVKNIMTSTKDDEYSHMLDIQYGLQEHLSDDTYDHTVDLEGGYGAAQITQNVNETYDQAALNSKDEVYSLPN